MRAENIRVKVDQFKYQRITASITSEADKEIQYHYVIYL